MFIVSKRNIIIPREKGGEDVALAKGFMGEAPDWIGETAYFKALVEDGKIVLSETSKDKSRKKAGKPTKPAKEETPPKEETPSADAPAVPGEPPAEAET